MNQDDRELILKWAGDRIKPEQIDNRGALLNLLDAKSNDWCLMRGKDDEGKYYEVWINFDEPSEQLGNGKTQVEALQSALLLLAKNQLSERPT